MFPQEYDIKRKQYVELKKRQEVHKKELREAQARNAPIQAKLDDFTARLQQVDSVIKEKVIWSQLLHNSEEL